MIYERYDREIGDSWEVTFFDSQQQLKDAKMYLQNEPLIEEISDLANQKGYDTFEILKTTTEIVRYFNKGENNE